MITFNINSRKRLNRLSYKSPEECCWQVREKSSILPSPENSMYLEKWFQEKQWKSLQCPTSIQTTKTSHSQLCSISTSSSSTVSDTGVYLQADKTNGEAPVTFENKNSEHHTSHNSNCRSGLDSSNIFSNIVSNGAEVIASTSSYAYPKSKIYNEITPMIECKICTGQTHQYDKRYCFFPLPPYFFVELLILYSLGSLFAITFWKTCIHTVCSLPHS